MKPNIATKGKKKRIIEKTITDDYGDTYYRFKEFPNWWERKYLEKDNWELKFSLITFIKNLL